MQPAPASDKACVIAMKEMSVPSLRDQSTISVEGVNWTVAEGDYWVVAGLQGAGKSDFLMLTAGLMAPAAGSYHLFDQPMPIFDEARMAHRLRLGLVFENGQLFNHLTVMENVVLPLRYHHDQPKSQAEEQVRNLLEALELGPWADSTPSALSRNWQKRVGLARALVLKPQLLLLDNPLGGLDPRHASWWLALLDQLSAGHPLLDGRPITLVVTSADLRLWKGRAREFALLRDKSFAVLGTWPQLEAANSDLTQELMTIESPK